MGLSLGLVMGVVGASVALLIGILIFSEISNAIDCDSMMNEQVIAQCTQATDTAWIVIAILPIALFFAMFTMFGRYDNDDDDEPKKSLLEEMLHGRGVVGKQTLKEKRKISKEKQRRADEQMEIEHSDLVQHSFLTNWFRKKNG